MTDEMSAACAARAAALALDELARKLRTVGTPDAMQPVRGVHQLVEDLL
jgi:hypothetical protein